MASHGALKRLQELRDKLELRRDDIAVSQAALEDETRECEGRQEQLKMVRQRISEVVREADELGRSDRAEKARREEYAQTDLAMKHSFTTVLDQELRELKEKRLQLYAQLEEQAAADINVREVSVLYEDEEAVFRVVDEAYTFDLLIADACRYFEVNPFDMQLVNQSDELWSGDASVRLELANFENQYGRIMLQSKPPEEEEEDDDEFESLLLGKPVAVEKEEEEEEEEVVTVASGQRPKKRVKINRRQLIRELPVFLTFMILFILALFGRREAEGYFQVNAIRTILADENFGDYNEKAFEDIRNFEEVWEWIENVLIEGIYPDGKYNDGEFTPREVGTVMTYNRVVGGIRLRTIRARPNVNCPGAYASLNEQWVMNSTGDIYSRKFVPECWGDFSEASEETRPYSIGKELVDEHGDCSSIPAPPPPPDKYMDNYGGEPPTEEALDAMAVRKLCRAFTYMNATETTETTYIGKVGVYGPGGYVRDTDNPVECRQREDNPNGVCERGSAARDDLLLAVDQLKNNRWLDESTRAMMIKITFYNANLNLFMMIVFLFEFSRGGRVFPSIAVGIVNQEMFKFNAEQISSTLMDLVVSGFVIYYSIIQARLAWVSLYKTGSLKRYASDVWNILECIVLIAFYLSTYFRLMLFSELKPPAVIFEDYYTDFFSIGQLYSLSFALDSLCVIILFFKCLKYAQLNPSTAMLWSVLTRAAADMAYFIVFLGILLLAFSMMAMQFFGAQVATYSTMIQSLVGLLLVMLGQFDIDGMKQASPYLGVWFFFAYIITMVLIMMNIFLAILGDAYTRVRAQADQDKEYEESLKKHRKKVSWLEYLRHVRRVVKARMRMKKAGRKGGKRGNRGSSTRAALQSGSKSDAQGHANPNGKHVQNMPVSDTG